MTTKDATDQDSYEEKSRCSRLIGGSSMTPSHTSRVNDHKKHVEDNSNDSVPSNVPIDQGWAWVICAGCFVLTFVMSMYDQVMAVMYVDVVDKFDVSVTTAAVVFTVFAFTFSVGSIISTNVLVPKFGDRVVIVFAAIVNSASSLILAFSPNIAFYLTFHLFKGLSIGSLWIPALGLLGHYFKRRRSLATSITNSGIGVAILSVPPFVRVLLDNFGFRGTLFIVSGVEMQAIVMGMLLRPLNLKMRHLRMTSPASKNFQTDMNEKEQCSLLARIEGTRDFDPVVVASPQDSTIKNQQQTACNISSIDKQENNGPLLQSQDGNDNSCSTNCNDQTISTQNIDVPDNASCTEIETTNSLCKNISTEKTESSLLLNGLDFKEDGCSVLRTCQGDNCPEDISVYQRAESNKLDLKVNKTTSLQQENRSICKVLYSFFDFKLLSDWLMRLLLVSTIFGSLLMYIPTVIPTLAVKKGLDTTSAAMLLAICGGVNLISTLIQGLIIDSRIITASKFIILCQFILGTMCHLTHFFTTFPTLLLLSVAHGMFGGSRMSLMPVIAMDYVGVENVSKALGFNAMVATLSLSLHHPFLGYLLESTNSFGPSFHYVGFALYVSAGLFFLENVGRRLNRQRYNKESEI